MLKPLLLAFGGGVVSIIGVRFIFAREESTYEAFFGAVIAVLIIGLLGWYYYKRQDTDPRLAGDDLYYLGLLFTLTSLIVVLLQLFVFQSEDDDLRQRTHDLIGNFGIALVSTIAGILGRIIFQSLSDQESSAKLSKTVDTVESLPTVSESLVELRRTLRDASDAFSHFTRMTQSHAKEVKAHSESMVRDFNDRIVMEAEKGLADVMKTWQDAMGAFSTDSAAMIRRIDMKVESATQRADAALRSLSRDAEVVSKSLRRQLESDVAALSTLVGRMAATGKALESLAGSAARAASGSQSLESASTEAACSLSDRASEICAAYDNLVRSAGKVQEVGLASFSESVVKLTKVAKDQLEADSKKWLKSIIEIRMAAQKHLGDVSNDGESVRLEVEKMSASLEQLLPRLEQTRRSVEKAVRSTANQRKPRAREPDPPEPKKGRWWINGKWF